MRRQIGQLILGAATFFAAAGVGAAQPGAPQRNLELVARRDSLERALEAIAVIDRKVMVPMRDGVRMQADVYRPKDSSRKVPIIFVRTPYNFNWWDVRLG